MTSQITTEAQLRKVSPRTALLTRAGTAAQLHSDGKRIFLAGLGHSFSFEAAARLFLPMTKIHEPKEKK